MQTSRLKLWMTPWGIGMAYQSWRLEQVSAYRKPAMRGTLGVQYVIGQDSCLIELGLHFMHLMLFDNTSGLELNA